MTQMRALSRLVPLVASVAACSSPTGTEGRASASQAATETSARASSAAASPAPPSTGAVASSVPAAGAAPTPEAVPEGMVVVPEGYFLVGGESPENTPRHEGVVGRFFLDEHEVTVGAYQGCVDSKVCKPMRKDNPFCNVLFTDRDDHPVNCVDWNDADAFCKRVGKRLPREVEWEYAARGGAEQRMYSWGNEEPTKERSCYMHEGGSCVVKTHPRGAFGLFDMTGNVWEWTDSWYAPYPGEPTNGRFKVYRGGSWSRRFAKWMRNDLRNRYEPHEASGSLGFRCAKAPSPLVCPSGASVVDGGCVRTSGDPLCEPGWSFAEGKCRPGGIVPAAASPGATNVGSAVPGLAASATVSTSADPATETPVRLRSPSADKDCQTNFPGLPSAYQWKGGTFQAREPLIRAAGCKKRDVGVGWSSACCP
jgi:formylglycine-generating enzyme required for sulfatase activity